MTPIILLHSITFLAAFLLFQIELIIAKLMLPVYGGSFAVWGACLVFFQAFLLLGYCFVHWIIPRTGVKNYRFVHLILFLLPLLTFPGKAIRIDEGVFSLFLAGDVFWRLTLTIGPVFFVLSTTSVALQMWLAGSSLEERSNPYALYATSNAGSLLAILTYPFLFEVLWDLREQLLLWRIGYAVLAALNVLLFFYVPAQNRGVSEEGAAPRTPKSMIAVWTLLSAASVMMFMSVTSVITCVIIPIPLLWIIPFGIYILAFILNFKPKPWCPAWIKGHIHVILPAAALLFFAIHSKGFSPTIQLGLLTAAVFTVCFYCQNQLAERRPASDRELTKFYLVLSLGGCLGGVITSWVMPLVSRSFVEYLLSLTLITAAVWILEWKIAPAPPSGFLARLRSGSAALVPLLLVFFWAVDMTGYRGAIYKMRNYYGTYEIKKMTGSRILIHGTTLHGMQFTDKTLELEPTCMFSRTSPVGELLSSDRFNFRDIAVIGLGAGMLAIYTRPDQTMDYYELDPDVYKIAKKYFSFLDHAKGKVRFVFGDARQTLAKEKERKYDLLIVDAFGGDSIPFHLLTVEAINLYLQRLKPGGILLFHVSNRYIRLAPPLTQASQALKSFAGFRATSGEPYGMGSSWVVFTWDQDQFQKLVLDLHWYPLVLFIKEKHRLWTDAYSNILPVINVKKLKESLQECRLFF